MIGTLHIVLAMKPTKGNFVENALQIGVSGLNIDGCRVGSEQRTYKGSGESQQRYSDGRAGLTDGRGRDMQISVAGRWPPNVILGHSEGCVDKDGNEEVDAWECTDGCPVKLGGASRFFKQVGRYNDNGTDS